MAKKRTVDGVSETKVEARDYVHDNARRLHFAELIEERLKEYLKDVKELKETLRDNIGKGAIEKPRTGMLFQSLGEAKGMSEDSKLQHLEVGVGVMARIQTVAMDDLEAVRKEIGEALDRAATEQPAVVEGAEGSEEPEKNAGKAAAG